MQTNLQNLTTKKSVSFVKKKDTSQSRIKMLEKSI